MQQFFEMFVDWFNQLFALLNSYTIEAFGVNVSLLVIYGAFIVLSMVISLFWKGAKG